MTTNKMYSPISKFAEKRSATVKCLFVISHVQNRFHGFILGESVKSVRYKLNRIDIVQVCDATGADKNY